MPSTILSKAARTAADGPSVVVVRPPPVAGEGDGVAGADLVTVFGVGVGFASTVRPRLNEELLLVFCAKAKAMLTQRIEMATSDLFIKVSSSGGRVRSPRAGKGSFRRASAALRLGRLLKF